MIWVTCYAGVAAATSLVDGVSGLLLCGVDWIYWAVNTDEVQGLEHGDPLHERF